jgi:hypothetical protein
MMIRCPSCSCKLEVPDRLAGKKVRCPKCATAVQVPELQSPPVEQAESSHVPPFCEFPASQAAPAAEPSVGVEALLTAQVIPAGGQADGKPSPRFVSVLVHVYGRLPILDPRKCIPKLAAALMEERRKKADRRSRFQRELVAICKKHRTTAAKAHLGELAVVFTTKRNEKRNEMRGHYNRLSD